jgi:hypothetical protein
VQSTSLREHPALDYAKGFYFTRGDLYRLESCQFAFRKRAGETLFAKQLGTARL